jgi:16S rRNA (guanine966-N2)-methyltransferase
VRVVSGAAGGLRLRAPRGRRTRPSTDRVREAVFDLLQSRVDLSGADVVDLFSGSGAMGIEALSRGAAHATFVESDRSAVAAIRDNLARTGLEGRATVARSDVLRWLSRRASERFDLAFVDPPYAFDRWPELLGRLSAALAVLETRGGPPAAEGWEVVEARRYGDTVVALMEPSRLPRPNR